MQISEQDINAIRQKANITEIIGHYIPLVKKGRGFSAVCPFHDDHDPSLSISEEKQIYKCFVCGNGGNVFTFVKDFEKVSFQEAVYKVADLVGYKLEGRFEPIEEKIAPEIKILYQLHEEAIRFSSYQLHSSIGEEPLKYLLNRGLDENCINYFNIGYIPSKNSLYRFLSAKGYQDQDIVSAYLGHLNENGIYDVFSNRITFPIHDAKGHPIGFTARTCDPEQQSKYINTSETKIYVKGNILYNMHRALASCKKEKKVIIVEGVMDVIAFYRAGIENVVATLGTACTKEQIKLMKQCSNHVVFCYDGDKAGQNANYKAAKLAKEAGLEVSVISNKTGLDPDEIIKQFSVDELRSMAKKELTWIEFCFAYLPTRFDLENYSQKKEYAMQMRDEIWKLGDAFDRNNFLHQLSMETGFSLVQLNKEENVQEKNEKKGYKRNNLRLNVILDGKTNAEHLLLSQMLTSYEAVQLFSKELGFLLGEENQKLAMILIDYYRDHDYCEIADFLNFVEDSKLQKLVMELDEWEIGFKEYNEQACEMAIRKIKSCMIDSQIEDLKRRVNTLSNPESKAVLVNEIFELKKQKDRMIQAYE